MRAPISTLLFLSLSVSAPAAIVSGQSTFTGGEFGDWSHSFTSGPAGITITAIKITLNSGLLFDSVLGGPGLLLPQNIATSSIGGTGFTAFSATGGALDGAKTVTLTFSGFNPGETFTHVADVDRDCSGLPLLAQGACVLTGAFVSGSNFAGSTVEITFGGPMLAIPATAVANFVNSGGDVATATWTADVALVPEPSTLLLSGAALVALGLVRRGRK